MSGVSSVTPSWTSSIGVLALASWLVLAGIMLPGFLSNPRDHSLYQWIIFATSAMGMIGAVAAAFSRRGWRILLAFAASLYLFLFGVRFFVLWVSWQLEYSSFLEALRLALWSYWTLLAYPFSQGRIMDGIALSYYEALMPLAQLIVLVLLATSNRRLQADAPKAARA